MKFVTDVIFDWGEMDGETNEIKRLNSLLTEAFIGRRELPADECHKHATTIIEMFASDVEDWTAAAEPYLRSMFATSYRAKDNQQQLYPDMYPHITDTIQRVGHLLKGGSWPDRPFLVI